MQNDIRKNTKVSMNRQELPDSLFFGMRKNNVKWPTLRKAYMTDENVETLRKLVTTKGRSIIFLDGAYTTKLNRYVKKDPIERAVFFEYMVKDPNIKGAIFMYCWVGNFHNGTIAHFSFQYPQMNCWVDALGKEKSDEFFDRCAFNLYSKIAEILYGGMENITDKEVKQFIEHGQKNI
jgi:hypothetical protein